MLPALYAGCSRSCSPVEEYFGITLLEAAAEGRPVIARELHDSVAALVSRMAGNGTEPGEQTEIGEPSYGDVGGQNQLMSLLESLADRLEARARV